MNRGLKSYGIMLIMITTLIFTLNFGVVNATSSFSSTSSSSPAASSSINPNNSTQANPLTGLNSDSNDVSTCEDCASNNDDNGNDDNNNDGDSSSSGNDGDGEGDVPMSLPFNSNLADESDDEKDYSNAIPFP